MGICADFNAGESSKFALAVQAQSDDEEIKKLDLKSYVKYPNQEYRYVGNWQAANLEDLNGRGIIYEPGKFYYEGNISKGEACGQGIIKWEGSIADCYQGQFKENKPDGDGIYKNNEFKFDGKWQQGEPLKGILSTEKQKHILKKIQLRKVDNFTRGYVEVTMSDGTYYEGEVHFLYDEFYFDGEGRAIFNDGNQYRGFWSKGKMHGKGRYEWAKEKIAYEGEYKFGKKDGEGKYYFGEKKYLKGRWEQGKKQGTFQVVEEVKEKEVVIGGYKFSNDEIELESQYPSELNG